MEPYDKFGSPLYPRVYRMLQDFGRSLEGLGYSEAKKKPNLFYFKTDIGVFFCDMRGTEIIPIWSVPEPMFYWNLTSKKTTLQQRQKALLIEGCRLLSAGVKIRLSNELHDDDDDLRDAQMLSDMLVTCDYSYEFNE